MFLNLRKFYIIIIFTVVGFKTFAQVGGESTYRFLDLTNSARLASLGGKNISANDNDLNLVYFNPALLNPAMDSNLTLNYISYFAGINYGYTSYAYDLGDKGTLSAGVHFVHYGTFTAAEPDSRITGEFSGSEYALYLSYSRPIDSSFRWGVTFKPIFSSLERYSSMGLATDLGITYTGDEGNLVVAAVLRNVGFQVYSYSSNGREPIPFEILLGVTKKLRYAPFRISVTAHNLQRYKMTYTLPEEEKLKMPEQKTYSNKFEEFTDNALRHLIFSVDFLPTRRFYFTISYNHQRKKEMEIQDVSGSEGISYGFGLKLKKLSLSYGRSVYHQDGGSNTFSLIVNLGQFYHR